LRQIRARMRHISLAASPAFHDIFIREDRLPDVVRVTQQW
jgi:hypothetical protein